MGGPSDRGVLSVLRSNPDRLILHRPELAVSGTDSAAGVALADRERGARTGLGPAAFGCCSMRRRSGR